MIKVEILPCQSKMLPLYIIKGMRNPMNSWDKSDSYMDYGNYIFRIGNKDKKLMKQLIKAGAEHRKFLRQLPITMEITAPLYWWKEFDTYKVGTVSNSCSTMHKIHEKEFTLNDFSVEHIGEGLETNVFYECMENTIECLNEARQCFLDDKNKQWWWQMIQLLPSSYNQTRTVTMNYENALAIINSRANHRLDEWVFLVRLLLDKLYIGDCKFSELLED